MPVNNTKYYSEDFVYIANDATIERQKSTNQGPERQGLLQSTDYWVAKILEVRALDEHHVYARVYWMYSPDELPVNTLDGKKLVSGRQPYHGQNELIASNHSESLPSRASVLVADGCASISGRHQRGQRRHARRRQPMGRVRRRAGTRRTVLATGL